jgi:NAD(P)-dependent dehydrogenase (short-subunit alcohol dehydrogenase family)
MGALRDTVTLVTGAGQGLGYDMACAFADAGSNLVITGRVQEKLDAKAEALRSRGVEVLALAGDVKARRTAEETVARALAAFGRIDVLINNAQTLSLPVPLLEQDDEHMESIIRSGLFGTMYFMQAAHAALAVRGGAIVNLGSGQSYVNAPGVASYAAAKAGISAVSRVAAREWGRDGIRVNLICPGAITDSFTDWFKDKPEELAALTSQSALGRFADGYKDVGGLALYLASPDCLLTGQTFYVDGGQIMP